jgi:hypothetical protein
MNWDAISAIVEVCGALAVLITLVYLAVQTRNKEARINGVELAILSCRPPS